MMKLRTLFLTTLALTAPVAQAGYVPLSQELPQIEEGGMDMPTLLNALLAMSVGIGAILAVIMLAIGGFNYMTSESVFRMGDAKEKISGAIIGLLIILSAILILWYINPEIVSMRIFETEPA